MSGNYVIEVNDASVEYYVQQRKGLISRAVVKRVRALDRVNVKIAKERLSASLERMVRARLRFFN